MTQTADIAEVRASVRQESSGATQTRPRLRIAYLTTAYPAVSHTFIRREVEELTRRGHEVVRLSIRRSAGELVDSADREEAGKTHYVLEQGAVSLLGAALKQAITSPLRFARALGMTWRMHRCSERGLVRHLAYLVEAAHLRNVLAREKVQHVHVHFGTNAAAVARLVRTLGGPSYSMTVHGPDEFDACIGLSLADKIADASFTIAISHFGAAQLRRWSEAEHWDRIHVVRCTIGTGFDDEPPPIDPGSRTLVCVGRLTAQKGQLLLIDAAARLVEQGVKFKLVLAGDGEMRPRIEQRIAQLQLRGHVTITGWISGEQVREHLRQARAMVLPSFAEGLPVVIMEAFAMSRPVISTYVAGIPELVEHGVNGWLVPAGDVDRLTDAMRAVLLAPVSELNEMGRAGRQRVLRVHATQAEVDKLEALLLETVQREAVGS